MVKPRSPAASKYRLNERQPFFLWLVLFGLLFQVDHLRRISSNSHHVSEDDHGSASSSSSTSTPVMRGTRAVPQMPKPPLLNRYKLPNVLVVGTQKAGTNSMASWIFRHLNVCQPLSVPQTKPVNGVHFFNTDDKYLKLGLDAYGQHFSHCTPENHTIVMDATPDYLPYADRVRATYDLLDGPYAKDLKVIMVMREPVEREFSWYNNLVAVVNEDWTPRQLVKKVKQSDGTLRDFPSYLDDIVIPDIDNSYGLYAKWFQKWVNNFGRKQILVLSYDELAQNPKSFQKRVKNFLELKPDPNEDLAEIVNLWEKGGHAVHPPVSCSAQASLAKYYKESNKEFYDLMQSSKGPSQEQKPFPKFQLAKCKEDNDGNKKKGDGKQSDKATAVKKK